MRLIVASFVMFFASSVAAANLSLVIVSGMGGTEEYTEQFNGLADRLAAFAAKSGLPPQQIHRLAADSSESDGYLKADKQQLRQTLTTIANTAAVDDELLLVLIGHGTPRDQSALFNIPGPDLDPVDLDELLDLFGERRVAVVNAASASGPFLRPLSAPNRIIITATSSGTEFHAVEFPQYLVAAFEDGRADSNKDQRVSLLEAFNYAKMEVQRSYQNDERLLTEHALIDDNGDGEGSLSADEFSNDGPLAAALYIEQPAQLVKGASAEMLALLDEKKSVEEKILELKRRKQFLQSEAYYEELEVLLIRLARLAQRLRDEEST